MRMHSSSCFSLGVRCAHTIRRGNVHVGPNDAVTPHSANPQHHQSQSIVVNNGEALKAFHGKFFKRNRRTEGVLA